MIIKSYGMQIIWDCEPNPLKYKPFKLPDQYPFVKHNPPLGT